MKNAATTGSCIMTSASRTIQPPTYDGQTPWSSYKIQFEAAAMTNLWDEEQKATAWVIALRGTELEMLQTLSDEDISKYSALTIALGLRFASFCRPIKDKNTESWRISTRICSRFQDNGTSSIPWSTNDYSRMAYDRNLRRWLKLRRSYNYQVSGIIWCLDSCAGSGSGAQFFKNLPPIQGGRTRDGRNGRNKEDTGKTATTNGWYIISKSREWYAS